jgi:hypothetical protein
MPEITSITSEALQAEVRRLLPSQRGFGNDLEAQNVIVPIVDLTPTAEGSALREDLQTAVSFDNVTTEERIGAGSHLLSQTPGFYKYQAILSGSKTTGSNTSIKIQLTEGPTVKNLHTLVSTSASVNNPLFMEVEGVVFLDSGTIFSIISDGTNLAY